MTFKTFTTNKGTIQVQGKNSLIWCETIKDWIESDETKEEYENYLNHFKQGFIKENGVDKK